MNDRTIGARRLPRDPRSSARRASSSRRTRRGAARPRRAEVRARAVVPTSGWRIYTIGGSMPTFDPATYRLAGRRARRAPDELLARRPARRCRAPSRSRTSTASPAGRSTTSAGRGVRIDDLLDAARREARRRRRCASSPPRCPYDDSLTARAGAPARRDARLRDGRRADLPAARRPRAARDAADVRLQERQVGRPASSSAPTRCPATGSSTATTPTRGSGSRMASPA